MTKPTWPPTASQRNGIIVLTKELVRISPIAMPAANSDNTSAGVFTVASTSDASICVPSGARRGERLSVFGLRSHELAAGGIEFAVVAEEARRQARRVLHRALALEADARLGRRLQAPRLRGEHDGAGLRVLVLQRRCNGRFAAFGRQLGEVRLPGLVAADHGPRAGHAQLAEHG